MAANLIGMANGYEKDKGSSKGKKIVKALVLGGGYSGYERARNQGQSRLKAGVKARLGGFAYSAAKGLKKESLSEKARKYTRGEKGKQRIAAGAAVGVGTAAYLKNKKSPSSKKGSRNK